VTSANRAVSSENEELILVDVDDEEAGFLSKAQCHDGDGVLHRAFSVFLFNPRGELLLQQRASSKRLWPGYWSNSCCSHPRRGERMEVATRRRLQDELNTDTALEFVFKFRYRASFGAAGSEHELCHVFLGTTDDLPEPNRSEIDALRFVSAADLETELAERPGRLTPWFKLEWQRLVDEHPAVLARYLAE